MLVVGACCHFMGLLTDPAEYVLRTAGTSQNRQREKGTPTAVGIILSTHVLLCINKGDAPDIVWQAYGGGIWQGEPQS